ncbi:hypothetical protein B0H34DRAFT_674846 [Crassisporium funariophilum]|nr:hypothetical protein B0H34DRAFT_674846 [Crassisporium funariophilum]
MSSALVIRSKSKKRPSIFDECLRAQRSSSDIVIYSALATQIVRVAWPLYRGVKIKPSGIKDWLRARGLHWACFCGMTAASGVHLSAQIVHTIAGDVVVFCHYEPSTCNFFLNLSDIFQIARCASEYTHLQKIDQLQGSTGHEAVDLVNLRLSQLVTSEVAPLLKGFCGDFIAGVEQLSGSRQYTAKSASTTIRRQPRMSLPTMQSSPIQTASTSRQEAPATSSAGPSNLDHTSTSKLTDQRRVIARLAKGEGIEWQEWDGVVETCDMCKTTFLQANFKAHARGCWYESE